MGRLHRGFPSFGAAGSGLGRKAGAPGFAPRLRAQFWLEWQRQGWLLPGFSARWHCWFFQPPLFVGLKWSECGRSSAGGDSGSDVVRATPSLRRDGTGDGKVRSARFNARTASLHFRSSHDEWRICRGETRDGFGIECLDPFDQRGWNLSLLGDRGQMDRVFQGWIGHAFGADFIPDRMPASLVAAGDHGLEKSDGRNWDGFDWAPLDRQPGHRLERRCLYGADGIGHGRQPLRGFQGNAAALADCNFDRVSGGEDRRLDRRFCSGECVAMPSRPARSVGWLAAGWCAAFSWPATRAMFATQSTSPA